jgi:hypothetical protein
LDFGNPSRIRTRRLDDLQHGLLVFRALARSCTEVCVGCSHVPYLLGDECMRAPDGNRTHLELIDNQRTSPDVSRSKQSEGEIGFEPITVRLQRPTFYQLNYSPLRSFTSWTTRGLEPRSHALQARRLSIGTMGPKKSSEAYGWKDSNLRRWFQRPPSCH